MKKSIFKIASSALMAVVVLITIDVNAGELPTKNDTIPPPKGFVLNERKRPILLFHDTLPLFKSDTSGLWQKFKSQAEEKIDSNERRITRLESNMSGKEEKLKISYKKNIRQLAVRNEELKKTLYEYKEDEKENIKSFTQRFSRDIDAVTESIRKIKP